jgi:signal transduction histidine kinase
MRNYVFIAFTLIVMKLPGRVAQVRAVQSRMSLKEKQMFVRYISHEIRTPLNTVFLGLNYLLSEIQALHEEEENKPTSLHNPRIEPMLETAGTIWVCSCRCGFARIRIVPLISLSILMILYDTGIGDVSASCEVALSILNDLLTFDKLQSGKMVIEPEKMDPYKFILAAVKPFALMAREKEIEFSIVFEDDDRRGDLVRDDENNQARQEFYALVDENKMSQVLRNNRV